MKNFYKKMAKSIFFNYFINEKITFINEPTVIASIIIVNYNGKKYIDQLFKSINELNTEKEKFEIIFVDNASSDDTLYHLENVIMKKYPLLKIRVLKLDKNYGYAKACNKGASISRGKYLVFLNNDTVVDKEWLNNLLLLTDRYDIIGSKILFLHDKNVINNVGSYLTSDGDGGDIGFKEVDKGQYDYISYPFAVCGASFLVKREVVEDIGLFDEDFFMYYEDTDFSYRAQLRGYKIAINPNSVVYHVHCGTSVEWSPFFTFHVFRNKILMHMKNSSLLFLSRVLLKWIVSIAKEFFKYKVNRKVHIKVIFSLMKKTPKFMVKRLYVKWKKRVSYAQVYRKLRVKKPFKLNFRRICIYNAYLPTMGGGESHIAKIIECLYEIFDKPQIDILLHPTEAFDSYFYEKNEPKKILEDFVNKFNVRRDSINTIVYIASKNRIIQYLKILKYVKKYDLFINSTFCSKLYGNSKFNVFLCMFPHFLHISKLRLLNKLYENKFINSYDVILANSEYTSHWVNEYWNVNSTLLYPPVEVSKNFKKKSLRTNITIVNIGRFFVHGHSKRQDILIRAFKELYERVNNKFEVKLILIGRVNEGVENRAYLEELRNAANGLPVYFYHDISKSELQNILTNSHVYWHATGYKDVDPIKQEHFGISIIEAMSFGLVPFCYNNGGPRYYIKDGFNGFLYNDIDELVQKTIRLIENEEQFSFISYNAFLTSQRYDEEFHHKRLKYILTLNK